MIQGSDEWHQARLGKVTASRVSDVVAMLEEAGKYEVVARDKGKFAVIKDGASRATKILDTEAAANAYAAKCAEPRYASSRFNYMAELICERLTGQPAQGFTSAAMVWGTETEPEARSFYEMGAEVEQVGFIDHPTIPMSGASPDGLVGKDGLLEIKCPNTATHIDFLLSPKIPQKYLYQMQWQMDCTEREWCDYLSFDPRLPGRLQAKIVRVDRDEGIITMLREEITKFLNELEAKINQLEAA